MQFVWNNTYHILFLESYWLIFIKVVSLYCILSSVKRCLRDFEVCVSKSFEHMFKEILFLHTVLSQALYRPTYLRQNQRSTWNSRVVDSQRIQYDFKMRGRASIFVNIIINDHGNSYGDFNDLFGPKSHYI